VSPWDASSQTGAPMMNLNPFRIGVIALAIALAMLFTELLWRPVFTIQLGTSVAIPLWLLAAIFAGLQFYLWHATRRHLTLSDEEVSRWGDDLAKATPTILSQAEDKIPVRDIAETIQTSHGIPIDVTLRYIIAMGHHTDD
jgi:hypothetical protein